MPKLNVHRRRPRRVRYLPGEGIVFESKVRSDPLGYFPMIRQVQQVLGVFFAPPPEFARSPKPMAINRTAFDA